MVENQQIKGGVLSVQESAQYLGVSRSSFWRKAKSDGFPSKVVINNKVGYRPEDLEKWYSEQATKREGKRSDILECVYLGKAQFILHCRDLARDCVGVNALRKGESMIEARKRFDSTLDRLKENYSKVFPEDLEEGKINYEGNAWRNFIGTKEEIIKLVWPEIDTDDLSEEDILAF